MKNRMTMKTTRRQFLQASVIASLPSLQTAFEINGVVQGESAPRNETLDAFAIASKHMLSREIAGPTFFEGMLLGNGDVGVCAVVCPDALGIHISKSDCWDIRVSEDSNKDVVPFADILKMWQRASDEAKQNGNPNLTNIESGVAFFREYSEKVGASYSKPWPRPWPCGTVWLKWDPRWVETGRYTLDPSNGLFTLELRSTDLTGAGRLVELVAFVDWDSGMVSVRSSAPVDLLSVIYMPQVDGFHAGPFDPGQVDTKPGYLPAPEVDRHADDTFAEFSCFQYFPSVGPTTEQPISPKSNKDRNFSLCGRIAGKWTISEKGIEKEVSFTPNESQAIRLDVIVATPRDLLLNRLLHEGNADPAAEASLSISQSHLYDSKDLETLAYTKAQIAALSRIEFNQLQQSSEGRWREFWSHSAVSFRDKDLEKIWYHNQYFLACCLRKNKTAPGLFANWSSGNIGNAWHGDYHLDYNCQQVYWGVFSSNHIDMHAPYVELCENLMPMSEKFAHDSFNMPGAFFPLSAYPVPSQIVPYPAPPWGYQICMTPWAVQSLWWQYLYTQDELYLRRVYPMMRAAARFLAAYVKKEDDGHYHIFPSVSSENWGFTVDFRLNKDCILDLALTRFLLNAMVEASTILATDTEERTLWSEIRDRLAAYPVAKGPYGEVWLDIAGAPVEHIYNVPITLAPVFPGEQVGLGKSEEHLEIARRTARTIRLEGGNDLVSQSLIRTRLGMLDLEWFKSQIDYGMLTDGVSNDRVRQSGGRYGISTDFDFMMRMGLWCENFAVPVVLNECMLQSYTGVIRLFPNTKNLGPARFEKLRAAGAFLVSASHDGKSVVGLKFYSEKGATLRFVSPWTGRNVQIVRERDDRPIPHSLDRDVIAAKTEAGETYLIAPA
jgi:alpha-L-fucosidase 2